MAAIHAASFPPRERWSTDVMALQLGLPGVFGLIDPEGGVVLARVVADEAEILTLAVVPEARGRGCAAGLLREAVRSARTAGAAAVFLEVSAVNAPAQALYAKAGFREVGRRRHYYPDGADALVLRRVITCGAAKDG